MSEPLSARKDGTNIIYSIGPDVCWTPLGSLMIPVPYFSIAFLDSSIQISKSVFNNSNSDFQMNSRASVSTGHEPGTGKGIKVSGYKGMAFAKKASSDVYSEGYAFVRDGDLSWINRPGPGGAEPRMSLKKNTIKTNLPI